MSGLLRVLSAVVMALRAVRRNKLRSALTTLGICIGVAAVVTVTALATGARDAVSDQISTLGSNALMVFPRSARASGVRTAGGGSRLSELDVEAVVRGSTSIRAAAPFMRATSQAVHEGENVAIEIIGTRQGYLEIRNWKLTAGEVWTSTAENLSDKVVLLGSQTAKDLFGTMDPVGRVIRIGRHPYAVVGVLEEKGQSPFGRSQDEVAVMPITTMRSHIIASRPNDTHAILISATSPEVTDRAKRQTEEILRQRHKIKEGDEDDFIVRSQAEFKAMQDKIYGALSALLIGIAAISLVVGGIGVMNIMLVSVAERTREIGIRMAIGAREGDIMVQFLVEALVLSMLGGLIGTAFGYAAIVGFGMALGWPMKLEVTSLVVAVGVSSAIGLVFGFFPARSAARMDPVQALGRE